MIKKLIAVGSIVGMALTALPVLASNTITIINSNTSLIINEVLTISNSGWNEANGGNGGTGGSGGSVVASDDGNTGGNGGNAGAGGAGGDITTGDATSATTITNKVGKNKVEITACNCDLDDITVINGNEAEVGNGVLTDSDSGLNVTDGGNGGGAGAGGSVTLSDDNNTGGNGGNGGNGGAGGIVNSGWSTSVTTIVNRIGKNITRIN